MTYRGFHIDVDEYDNEPIFVVTVSEDEFEAFGNEYAAKDWIDRELVK